MGTTSLGWLTARDNSLLKTCSGRSLGYESMIGPEAGNGKDMTVLNRILKFDKTILGPSAMKQIKGMLKL